jgi:DNA-binding transcriptional LysR family regulator
VSCGFSGWIDHLNNFDLELRSLSMELRQLRAVEAVARLCHFTRAADELHVAQSALSHQIRQLERELGTPLFERTSRRVRPTEAGLVVARRARHVMEQLDGAVADVDALRGLLRGRIRVGALLPAGDVESPACSPDSATPTRGSRSGCTKASPATSSSD